MDLYEDESWGVEFIVICDGCGTYCGGSEGQDYREKEWKGGCEIICAECDPDPVPPPDMRRPRERTIGTA